ncbi:class I ribonucleotide reductase maintenance protein YfaE [Aliiglaciecola sp. M165]|uniref:class I ribonucleotide reductase maintenance protein YfaE n=1 Tax=Aliiglaciecola sp. M165 TaxID=2593649 RepID=UPI00117E2915|nr:class I ribonucleotide reductase maintenance protein YfaE [Aliiglaciecola sp. M165]TRY30174.1 2Fe-2S ferredoxin-like protein [Aliiglaciecola sp. M165]
MSDDTRFVITIADHKPIPCETDKTVLENLEAQNVEVHYHCREGFCGACRTKLIKGEVDYTTDPLAYIDDDEFLPCCTIALTDIDIKIEY